MNRYTAVVAGLCGALLLPASAAGQQALDDTLASRIRLRIEAGAVAEQFWAADDRLTAERALPGFYRTREFRPAWSSGGRPSAAVRDLLRGIEEAAGDGLTPTDYHLRALQELLDPATRPDLAALVDLDLLATDAFLMLGSHLLHGRSSPTQLRAEWLADRRGADMAAVLSSALTAGDVQAALDALRPRHWKYARMREALSELRAVEARGGWPRVDAGPTLRLGDADPRVPALRRRLVASGDLTAAPGSGQDPTFDQALDAAVRRFQTRHGLEADGAVGTGTLEALNVPVADRIQRLVINLERWRWMPDDLGRRHILVNIPDFAVDVRDDGRSVLRLRAIVGRDYRQTPVFSGRMTYLVLSPFWHVPPGIAANDKFPLIRQDPSYIQAQQMTLLDQRENRPVDPGQVDWSALTPSEFNRRYRLRQDPGPLNALGDVKFMFPNQHNVYLHDTPSRELFSRTERNFSSGCIRVDRPLDLAELLLEGLPSWDRGRIQRVVAGRSETTVSLPEAVPVHLQYWTAFVDDEGRLNYRRDIYSRDAAVLAALTSPRPGP